MGSAREKRILCILLAYSVCRSFAPHVEGEGTIYLGNGGKGLSSVAVGETAGIFSDVVLAAKNCGTVRRPTTRRRQCQPMAAWDLVSPFDVGPAENEARGETKESGVPGPMVSSFSDS